MIMSLNVYLIIDKGPAGKERSGIFVRWNGQTVEITRAEWDEKFPGREPVTAKADHEDGEIYSANITHNLGKMASEAEIYYYLWRPDEIGIKYANELIEPLSGGLTLLKSDRNRFERLNPSNGWGDYDGLVRFVSNYLDACKEYPSAKVHTSI